MSEPVSILIVEDDELLRSLYEMILTSKGYRVTTAVHGGEALDALRESVPDLILLDLFMPVMDGKEFLIRSQARLKYPQTKIILFSNVSDTHIVEPLYQLGISHHVLKASLLPNDLVALVANSVRS